MNQPVDFSSFINDYESSISANMRGNRRSGQSRTTFPIIVSEVLLGNEPHSFKVRGELVDYDGNRQGRMVEAHVKKSTSGQNPPCVGTVLEAQKAGFTGERVQDGGRDYEVLKADYYAAPKSDGFALSCSARPSGSYTRKNREGRESVVASVHFADERAGIAVSAAEILNGRFELRLAMMLMPQHWPEGSTSRATHDFATGRCIINPDDPRFGFTPTVYFRFPGQDRTEHVYGIAAVNDKNTGEIRSPHFGEVLRHVCEYPQVKHLKEMAHEWVQSGKLSADVLKGQPIVMMPGAVSSVGRESLGGDKQAHIPRGKEQFSVPGNGEQGQNRGYAGAVVFIQPTPANSAVRTTFVTQVLKTGFEQATPAPDKTPFENNGSLQSGRPLAHFVFSPETAMALIKNSPDCQQPLERIAQGALNGTAFETAPQRAPAQAAHQQPQQQQQAPAAQQQQQQQAPAAQQQQQQQAPAPQQRQDEAPPLSAYNDLQLDADDMALLDASVAQQPEIPGHMAQISGMFGAVADGGAVQGSEQLAEQAVQQVQQRKHQGPRM